jgi:hypothetical protein
MMLSPQFNTSGGSHSVKETQSYFENMIFSKYILEMPQAIRKAEMELQFP